MNAHSACVHAGGSRLRQYDRFSEPCNVRRTLCGPCTHSVDAGVPFVGYFGSLRFLLGVEMRAILFRCFIIILPICMYIAEKVLKVLLVVNKSRNVLSGVRILL